MRHILTDSYNWQIWPKWDNSTRAKKIHCGSVHWPIGPPNLQVGQQVFMWTDLCVSGTVDAVPAVPSLLEQFGVEIAPIGQSVAVAG